MKKYRVYNIDWDVDCENDLADLPKEMVIEDENDLTNENYELSDFISDAISEKTGFCHCGCDFELIEETNNKTANRKINMESIFTEVRITHIDEETNTAYIDAWETMNDNEEGRVLGVINLTNGKISWREETSGVERLDPLVVEEIREFMKEYPDGITEEEEKTYRFRVTASIEGIIEVKAKNRDDALRIANEKVANDDYDRNIIEESDVEFTVTPITDGEWLKHSIAVDTEMYGKIYCVPRFDADENESFFDLYDDEDGYYGELHGVAEDEITSEMVEEQIDENLNL